MIIKVAGGKGRGKIKKRERREKNGWTLNHKFPERFSYDLDTHRSTTLRITMLLFSNKVSFDV